MYAWVQFQEEFQEEEQLMLYKFITFKHMESMEITVCKKAPMCESHKIMPLLENMILPSRRGFFFDESVLARETALNYH